MMTKITTLAGITTTVSMTSLMMGAGELLPYVIGGVALYLWLEAHKEAKRSLKSFVLIVTGAVVVGLGSKGIVSFGGNILEHWVVNQFNYINDIDTKVKTLIESFTYILSFALASMSRTMYNRFFASRDEILNIALNKTKKEI